MSDFGLREAELDVWAIARLLPPEPRPSGLPVAHLAGAGPALSGIPNRARDDALRVRNAELVFLQSADLVAQARGFLELEVGGGLAHPLLELADIGLEVMANQVR